jgi:hypothetical protein
VASAHDVEPGHADRAGVGPQERREDADAGRLARAVGAEEAEHRAGARAEVDAVERPDVAERLDQALDGDGGLGGLRVGRRAGAAREDRHERAGSLAWAGP